MVTYWSSFKNPWHPDLTSRSTAQKRSWVGIVVPHEAHMAVEAGDHEDVHRQSSELSGWSAHRASRKFVEKIGFFIGVEARQMMKHGGSMTKWCNFWRFTQKWESKQQTSEFTNRNWTWTQPKLGFKRQEHEHLGTETGLWVLSNTHGLPLKESYLVNITPQLWPSTVINGIITPITS